MEFQSTFFDRNFNTNYITIITPWLSYFILIPPGIGASLVTALFNRRLERVAQQRGVALPEDVVAHFDCRAGLFDTVPFVVGGNRGRNGGTVEKNMAPGLLRWDG